MGPKNGNPLSLAALRSTAANRIAGRFRAYWMLPFAAVLMLWSPDAPGDSNPHRSPVFDHLTQQDGLSQNAVLAIHQDNRGFLWFGTESGLNRYDGYDIRNYRNGTTAPDSLSSDYIWEIVEDDASPA